MILNPDTGDAFYGNLNSNMLPKIKEKCKCELASKNMRMAGSGGINESQYYDVSDFPLSISGETIVIPQMPLLTTPLDDNSEYDGRMGLASFMLYNTVSFDMTRMIMYPKKD